MKTPKEKKNLLYERASVVLPVAKTCTVCELKLPSDQAGMQGRSLKDKGIKKKSQTAGLQKVLLLQVDRA